MIGDGKVGLALFDGVADLFGGIVNNLSEATFFLNKLIGLMRSTGGTAVQLGHPDKAGTSEFTGCGAPENKPRPALPRPAPAAQGRRGAGPERPAPGADAVQGQLRRQGPARAGVGSRRV